MNVTDEEKLKKPLTRKGAKVKRKSEYRNPKFETNSNDQKTQNPKQTSLGFGVLDFPDLDLFDCEFVSDLEIRISDLIALFSRSINFLNSFGSTI